MLSAVSVIFICKDCRKKFSKMEEFIGHKKLKHPKEFRHVKCIAFEERPFGPEYRMRMQEEEEGDDDNASCAETISLSSDDSDDDLIELDPNVDDHNSAVPGSKSYPPTFDLNTILNKNIDREHGSSNKGPSNFPRVDLLNVAIHTYNANRSQNYARQTSLGRHPFFKNHHQQVEVEVESHHLDHAYYRSSLVSGNNRSQKFPSQTPANNWLTTYNKKSFNNNITDTDTGDLNTPTIPPQQNHLITENTNSFNFGIEPDYYNDFNSSMEHQVPLKTNGASSISSTAANIDDVAGPGADAYSLFTSLIQSNSSPGDDNPDCTSETSSPLPCFYDDIEIMGQDETDDADVVVVDQDQDQTSSAHLDVDVVKNFDPYGITFNIQSDKNESNVRDEGDDKRVTARNVNNKNDKNKIVENSEKVTFFTCEVCYMRFPSLSLKEIHQKYRFHFQQHGVSAVGNSTYYNMKPKRSQLHEFYEKLNKIRKIL